MTKDEIIKDFKNKYPRHTIHTHTAEFNRGSTTEWMLTEKRINEVNKTITLYLNSVMQVEELIDKYKNKNIGFYNEWGEEIITINSKIKLMLSPALLASKIYILNNHEYTRVAFCCGSWWNEK